MDLGYLDEAGFSPTLPTNYSWSERGTRLAVAYEAPQGRRVNALGALFTHGPLAGTLQYETWARIPFSHAAKPRKTLEEMVAAHGLTAGEVGVLDAARFTHFVWQVAGRPADAGPQWVRERPLTLVLDNYSVHKSGVVAAEQPAWAAAGIELRYLPAYSPELSAIEPVWNSLKQHEIAVRSFARVGDLKQAVEAALARKAAALRQAAAESTNLVHATT